jgi:hypothetical protein
LSRSSGADQTSSIGTSSSNSVGVGGRNVAGDGALMVTSDHQQSSPTPPLQRRLAKSFSVAPSHPKGSYLPFFESFCNFDLDLHPNRHTDHETFRQMFNKIDFHFTIAHDSFDFYVRFCLSRSRMIDLEVLFCVLLVILRMGGGGGVM